MLVLILPFLLNITIFSFIIKSGLDIDIAIGALGSVNGLNPNDQNLKYI